MTEKDYKIVEFRGLIWIEKLIDQEWVKLNRRGLVPSVYYENTPDNFKDDKIHFLKDMDDAIHMIEVYVRWDKTKYIEYYLENVDDELIIKDVKEIKI